MRVVILMAIATAVGVDTAHGLTAGPPPTLTQRLQQSAIVIRGRVVGVKNAHENQPFRNHYIDSLQLDTPRVSTVEFEIMVDQVFKGCVRKGGHTKILQNLAVIEDVPRVSKGDTSVFMLRGAPGRWHVWYEIPLRKGRPGVETEFREWALELLEARIDSIVATQPGDSVLSDRNQTLLPDYGSITGQIVSEYSGVVHARNGIQVVMDNGRTATTDWWGEFRLEGRAGTHVLTFPGTPLKPKKVRLPAGCFEFVQITAPY